MIGVPKTIILDKKTSRIKASSKLDRFLGLKAPSYDKGQEVDLFICEKTDLGYKAIVNNSHWGMIYKNEVFKPLHRGQQLKGYIKSVREDLKIDISLRLPGYQGVGNFAQNVLKTINDLGGSIPVTDKSPPEDIYALFEISKKKIISVLLLIAMLPLGCSTILGPDTSPPSIVFPYQWVGDIDKAKFNEPSGICWHSRRKTLFVVGDEGDICEIKTDGTLIKQENIRHLDFEGITHDPSSGLLYIAVEGAESIVQMNPSTFEVLQEFSLPRTFDGKTVLRADDQGIEAITFVPDPDHPEGGTFYVANQALTLTDEHDVSAIFEVELPLRSNDATKSR